LKLAVLDQAGRGREFKVSGTFSGGIRVGRGSRGDKREAISDM
jgi:hypothetical protein